MQRQGLADNGTTPGPKVSTLGEVVANRLLLEVINGAAYMQESREPPSLASPEGHSSADRDLQVP